MTLTLKPISIAIVATLASNAYATGEQKHSFNIPAQPLTTALQSLANQSGSQMLYAEQSAAGKKSPALKGNYTTKEAASLLLADSGLNANVADSTVTVKPADKVTALPQITVEEKIEDEVNNPSYNRTQSTTATKTDTPLMETPYAVTVVPQQVLKDKQITRVEDAITSVAGIQSSWTNGGLSDVFMMRGFQNLNLYKDGFLQPSALGGGTTKRQTANLEQIEVLKGAGSILYGRSEPGGVINLVTKRPLATPYNSIQQQFGSYGLFRTTVDSTGKITKDDKLLYRVNLSYENANSYRDFVKTDDIFFAPSLTWNISDKTQANLDITYEHFNNTSDPGIPPMGNRPAPVPTLRDRSRVVPRSDSACVFTKR